MFGVQNEIPYSDYRGLCILELAFVLTKNGLVSLGISTTSHPNTLIENTKASMRHNIFIRVQAVVSRVQYSFIRVSTH